MSNTRRWNPWIGCLLIASAGLVGCSPKTNVSATGNVPAQYSHGFVSVKEIWFHTSATAGPDDTAWVKFPLNTPVTYDDTKSFAHELARLLEREHPQLVVSDMKKSLRVNKILVDWSQNDDHKTTVCVYSLRAKDHPTVSTPVTWEEVEEAWKKKKVETLVFEAGQTLARCEAMGDLFAPLLTLEQKLPKLTPVAVTGAAGIELAAAGPVKNPKKKAVQKR